ncbi:hypothetical protein C7974DRAFT_60706 [Boeremia exigua]|uniref:uncharacterized protein n=1 Tax=Boeremia exigua TaxID=749465 RepID=UPI001E8E7EEC|nr:uncharacterized protein C7974DRAFT_60706 [Boeremia exigua]KAH6615199.1 hypothetical protein C7974DRAFT_60706 [Boeremia exigua]
MFAADLSWQIGESVGQRKERKAREHASGTPSVRTSVTSRSSSSTDRQEWWTSGLKKIKARTSSKSSSKGRPSTSPNSRPQAIIDPRSLQPVCEAVAKDFPNWELELPHHLRDHVQKPTYTVSKSLSPTLPSGGSMDLSECDVPELEGDISSRYTHSIVSISSRDHHWDVKLPPTEALNGIDGPHGCDPYTIAPVHTRTSFGSREQQEHAIVSRADVLNRAKRRTNVPQIETRMEGEIHPQEASAPEIEKQPELNTDVNAFRPLAQWDSLSPMVVPRDFRKSAVSQPIQSAAVQNKPAGVGNSTFVRTRFQRFIQRLESAGPQLVLDRLKESLQDPADSEEELLEQQLWLLTGFQLQVLGKARMVPKPQCDTGRILELYGNLSEVYQSSAMHPGQTVHFLTTKPQRSLSLPSNVSYLTVREFGTVPLPYPEDFFTHIRASTLPSLVPSAKLPELFRECYKLLAPGGLFEIRIMDAAPVRRTAGPMMRMWIDDRLSVNLEKLFRCSKPCSLVPSWLAEAGFELSTENEMGLTLPCVLDSTSDDVDQELSALIGQALWKDTWGPFVEDLPDEPKWWWEEDIIVQECLKRKTVLECRSLYAYKR